jgi:cellulose synthase operon protein B
MGVREVKMTFAALGAGPMELRGAQPIGAVNMGTRTDELIVAAKLHLRMTYSPAMLSDLSHVRVSLNGQVLAALPLPREQAGREVEREVELDARYFSEFNEIRFDLVGHYTNQCEDAQHSSLWAVIGPQSELELKIRTLELRNDLGLLPGPFFDRRDNRRLDLPVLLPNQPSRSMLRSAGIVASWFGALAEYRSARFPVSLDALPDRHALVFATNAARPARLPLADVQSPTISIIDHPDDPLAKLLVIQGRDDAQLLQAVEGLVLGTSVLSGPTASISQVKYVRRAAYDAPRWLRSDRAVRFGELVDSPEELQVSGISPPRISVRLRLPPDLFTWNGVGVPLDLRYRHTMTSESSNAQLLVSINNQLLRSYPLLPTRDGEPSAKLQIPLLQNANALSAGELLVPAFQLAGNNEMQFQFALERHRKGLCTEVFTDNSRSAIDPHSTIDISGFSHYAELPDLALFANSGYPYTRYADLAETAIVLPHNPSRESIEQLFFLLGRMGRHTGVAAVAYQLLDPQQAQHAGDVDLLILPGEESDQMLARWGKNLTLVMDHTARNFRDAETAPAFVTGLSGAHAATHSRSEVNVAATGSLGALVGFESPLSPQRSVVAFSATDDRAAGTLIDALENVALVQRIRGDVAIVRGGVVYSYQANSVYYVGSLPWWKWLLFHVSRVPLLLSAVTLGVATVLALWLNGWLQRRAAMRLSSLPRE